MFRSLESYNLKVVKAQNIIERKYFIYRFQFRINLKDSVEELDMFLAIITVFVSVLKIKLDFRS